MRFLNLDLNLLAALDLLLTERNVSRAADRMHMTQSAMSNALGRLRAYFNDELLVPVGRRMDLTPRAEMLRLAVRDILVRIETSVAAKLEFDPDTSDRTFRILASDYSLSTFLPDFLRHVEAPGRKLRFEFEPQTDRPRVSLENGETDLLIIPEVYASDAHPSETLYEERFVCIADVNHPRVNGLISVAAYCEERHVVMKPRLTIPSFETVTLEKHGITRNIEVVSFSFSSLPWLVIGSERIATVHERLARKLAQIAPIQIIPLPVDIGRMNQCIQWHSLRSSDPAILWLRSTLKGLFRATVP